MTEFYRTPDDMLRLIDDWLPESCDLFIEPSAGNGAIVRHVISRVSLPARGVFVVELNYALGDKIYEFLERSSYSTHNTYWADFLDVKLSDLPDVVTLDNDARVLVVMNPPFSQARQHIEHAISLVEWAAEWHVIALAPLALVAHVKARALFDRPFDLRPVVGRPKLVNGKTDSRVVAWFRFGTAATGKVERANR